MIDCILARDHRLERSGGRWFGNYETPCVPSKIGRRKRKRGEPLDKSSYGRKKSEGKDFNEDTNFGKLKRVPYRPLQLFLNKARRSVRVKRRLAFAVDDTVSRWRHPTASQRTSSQPWKATAKPV